jgi:hypothetical protein
MLPRSLLPRALTGLLAAGLFLGSIGCDNSDSDDVAGVPAVWRVTYAIVGDGDSTVAEVVYDDGSGAQTVVDDPALGWSVSFESGDGLTVGGTATGVARNGSWSFTVSAIPTGGSSWQQETHCEDVTGAGTACVLILETKTLP